MDQTPNKLHQCKTPAEQAIWIKRALEAGRILSDAGLWVGGVDDPSKVIRTLRNQGLPVITTKKWVQDAANVRHHDLAWRLG